MDVQDPVTREHQLWELVAAGDLDGFAACLLADGVFIDGDQVQTKTALVDGLREVTLESFHIGDVDATRLTDEVDTVVYRVQETVTTPAGAVSRSVVASSTWLKRGSTWVLALHHESSAG